MRLVFILFFLLNLNLNARYAAQIKDFLCGCDYCETVSIGEPLDIGRHLIMCHSWKESTMKTFRLMEEMKQKKLNDKHEASIKDTLPKFDIPNKEDILKVSEEILKEPRTIHNDYEWRRHELHGWNYSTTAQNIPNSEGWIYREDLKWVWKFAEKENFLYSVDFGWFHTMRYKSYKLLYWYDRKYWLVAGDFWWKK